jgi:hypothetical protein
MAITELARTAGAVLDYTIDWSQHLDSGDQIASVTWSVGALTLDSQIDGATSATARISGGTAGQRYTITCHVELDSGQEDERSIVLIVQQLVVAEWRKAPAALLDYAIDWAAYFPGETIVSAVWDVPVGLTQTDDEITATLAIIRLSGGSLDTDYLLTCHVVMSSGQEDDRCILIKVKAL